MQEVKKPQTPSLPFLGTIHQKNASIEVKKCASPRGAYNRDLLNVMWIVDGPVVRKVLIKQKIPC